MAQETILARSAPFTLPSGNKEAGADLTLFPDPFAEYGAITGTIQGPPPDKTPIPGACVKLLTADDVPLAHTDADANGVYLFADLPAGNYRVFAIATGYLPSPDKLVVVTARRTTTADIGLDPDPLFGTGAIHGRVTDKAGHPLFVGVRVALSRLNGTPVPIDVHPANDHGQVAFPDLAPGNYLANATAPGYLPADVEVQVFADEIANFVVALTENPAAVNGTVIGEITDSQGRPIEGAVVYLFRASDEVPIAFTRTSEDGFYLFCNVTPGDYFVKAHKEALRTR